MRLLRRLHRWPFPSRYWTQAEIDAAHERALRTAQEIGWK